MKSMQLLLPIPLDRLPAKGPMNIMSTERRTKKKLLAIVVTAASAMAAAPVEALVIDDGVVLPSLGSLGAKVPIASYDIDQTPGSGFGCWSHTFSGAATDTGRTVGGSVICSLDGGHVFDYANGSGTLNDGLIDAAHLLLTRADDGGVPLEPAIRLRLDQPAKVDEIRLLATGFTTINSVTVEINGTAIPFTPAAINGDPLNVSISLRGSVLALVPAQTITLSDFGAIYFGSPIDQFGISEIQVTAVPEPKIYALLLVGLGLVGWKVRRPFRDEGVTQRAQT